MVRFGAKDNARLNNFQRDHQDNVKTEAKRTRRHEVAWMNEIEAQWTTWTL